MLTAHEQGTNIARCKAQRKKAITGVRMNEATAKQYTIVIAERSKNGLS